MYDLATGIVELLLCKWTAVMDEAGSVGSPFLLHKRFQSDLLFSGVLSGV